MTNVFLACFLLVLNFLFENAYPIFRAECLLLLFFICVPAMLVGAALIRLKLRSLLYALIVFFVMDRALNISNAILFFGSGNELIFHDHFKLACVDFFIIVGMAFVFQVLKANISTIILVGLITSCVTTLFTYTLFPKTPFTLQKNQNNISNTATGSQQSIKNIFFIVLDEHIGLDGFEKTQEYDSLRRSLEAMYLKNNFTLYPSSYSNYMYTKDSVPSILESSIHVVSKPDERKIKVKVPFMDLYGNLGYRLFFYQSDYASYHTSHAKQIASVFTYPVYMGSFCKNLIWTVWDKSIFLLNGFIFQSPNINQNFFLASIYSFMCPKIRLCTGVTATRETLHQVEKDISDNIYGNKRAYFVHLLAPHSSYIYDRNGGVNTLSKWQVTDLSAERKELYYNQVIYLHSELNSFMKFLQDKKIYESSLIVLIGDHGSRICKVWPVAEHVKNVSDRDFVYLFSNFLAVKMPYSKKGEIVSEQLPAIKVIARLFSLASEEELNNEKYDLVYLGYKKTKFFKACRMPLIKNVS